MNRKIYKLSSNPKQVLFALAFIAFSGTVCSQASYTLSYTGSVQNLTLSAAIYQIECWGADGGDGTNGTGGNGGYSQGTLVVTAPTTYYVYVGGRGITGAIGTAGGWNGGGTLVGSFTSPTVCGSGGGGTDIRTTQNNIYANRIIVAGGGGGGNGYGAYTGNGGDGGGSAGGGGASSRGITYTGGGGTAVAGGTAATGGIGGYSLAGALGIGGDYVGTLGGTAGGGGYFGGGSGHWGGAGGGGSGYVGGVTSGTTIAFGQPGFMPRPIVTRDGLVIVKELCAITLSVIGLTNSGAGCAGNSVTLTTNAISNYSWSNGATTSSIVVSPLVTTQYSLTAMSLSNCITSAVMTVSVNTAPPTLSVVNTASASGGICPNSTVNLTASGAITYTWTGGSPTVTNGVTFGPTLASTYIVTGANGCGTGTAVTSVSVHPFPTVNPAASSSTLCEGSTLSLTATGNATNYVWSGGTAPGGNGVGFIPSASMVTYSVIGTSALSCTALATIPVTVFPTPIIAPAASQTLICIGQSATLSAQGAINYTWTSATQTVFTPNFTVTPSAPGVTTYTVRKANSSCVDTKMISITTNSLPTVSAVALPSQVCALQPATLSIAGGQSYTWTAPGTPTYNFNGATPVVYPLASSLYTVAASDGTCITVTTLSLTVDPNPTISITASSPTACIGQSVTLTANGGNSYTWTTPSGTLSGSPIQVSPTSATSYTLTGDNSFSCAATANQVVLVYTSPAVGITVNMPVVCTGGTSTLTASGAGSYLWSTNANSATTPSAMVNPTAVLTGPVTYSVTGYDAVTGCPGTQTALVTVYIPTFAISGNTNTCQGGNVTLIGSGANSNSYFWNTGSGGPLQTQTLVTVVNAPAVFTLSASGTFSQVTCSSTQTIAVGINANPTITAAPVKTTVCVGESVEIHAGGAISYTWQNPGSGTTNGATLNISPPNLTNNYTVTGTDANGCVGTGTTQVKVSTCPGFSELTQAGTGVHVYPNPNNGVFTIQASRGVLLTVSNELGQTVKTIVLSESNKYAANITDLAEGIYFVTGQTNEVTFNQKIVVTK